jgi:hypothetical protein
MMEAEVVLAGDRLGTERVEHQHAPDVVEAERRGRSPRATRTDARPLNPRIARVGGVGDGVSEHGRTVNDTDVVRQAGATAGRGPERAY